MWGALHLVAPIAALPSLSLVHVLLSLAVAIASSLFYRWFLRPLNIRREHEPLPSNAQRRLGPVPDAFPTGWFRLCFSADVPRGRPVSFPAFGSSLLAFRGADDGLVHVLDPYCPHLGADMQDGTVVGDCVECPFHGWRFKGADGKCAAIPYSDAPIPAQAQVEAWAVRESHGMVMVWYDAVKRPPSWEPPLLAGRLAPHGVSEHRVGCAIQEIPENGADISHLDYLHGGFMVGGFRQLSHLWTDVSWRPAPAPDEHLAHIKLTESFALFGRALPGTAIEVTITQMGLGMVQLSFATPFGNVLVVESITPTALFEVRAGHVVLAEPWVPRFVAKFVLRALLIQFERDIPIWNKKTFVSPPMAVKGDGPLLAYRRWAAKLYPPKHLRLERNHSTSPRAAAASCSHSHSHSAAHPHAASASAPTSASGSCASLASATVASSPELASPARADPMAW